MTYAPQNFKNKPTVKLKSPRMHWK